MCAMCGHDSRVHLYVMPDDAATPPRLLPEPVTIGIRRLEADARMAKQGNLFSTPSVIEPYERPHVRSDCLAGGMNEVRPCPFALCRHHLGVDIGDDGDLRVVYPDGDGGLDIDAMPETCALDIAENGEMNLEELGAVLRYSPERIFQFQAEAVYSLSIRRTGRALKRAMDEGGFNEMQEGE